MTYVEDLKRGFYKVILDRAREIEERLEYELMEEKGMTDMREALIS